MPCARGQGHALAEWCLNFRCAYLHGKEILIGFVQFPSNLPANANGSVLRFGVRHRFLHTQGPRALVSSVAAA